MTTTRKRLIVLAGTLAQAKRHADTYGLPHAAIVWPRNVSDLNGLHHLPVYIGPSIWSHPRAMSLTEYAGDRLELTTMKAGR